MAKHGSSDVGFFLVDGYNLAGVLTTFTDTAEATTEETTCLGVTDQEATPAGTMKADLSQDGFFDDAVNSEHQALAGQGGVSRVVCYGLEGNTAGKRFRAYAGAYASKYVNQAQRGSLHKANATYTVSGAVEDGDIVQPLATVSGDGQSAAVDNLSATTKGGRAYIQVTALTLSGRTGVTVTIQHSVDGTTWVDLASVSAIAAAPTASRIVVAGTINRYLRCTRAFAGTGGTPTVSVMAGVVRL